MYILTKPNQNQKICKKIIKRISSELGLLETMLVRVHDRIHFYSKFRYGATRSAGWLIAMRVLTGLLTVVAAVKPESLALCFQKRVQYVYIKKKVW
jgi:isopentenyldiphosphate isomerase